MKKTLMVLSFALCASVVFAQNVGMRSTQELKAASKATVAQTDLSKALFVKDGTPLVTVDFHDGTVDTNGYYSGTGYSTGVVTSGLERHQENYAFAKWRRWPNVEQNTIEGAGSSTMSSVYPALYQNYFGTTNFATYLVRYADTATSSAENGFMMMSLYDQRTRRSGNFNAFIQISTVDASAASVIDVEFFQYYRKYYDNCYIDYRTSSSSSWIATEINVRGVDITVNGALGGFIAYTLPLGAAGQATLDVRIRYLSLDSNRGAYGYFWLIDDVSIVAADADRLKYYDECYTEGNYSIIPQGMTINPSWLGQVKNNGSNNQTNVTVTLNHMDAEQINTDEVSSYNNGTIAAGNMQYAVCDPYGWIFLDSVDAGYLGWTCIGRDISRGTGNPIPTDVVGTHYLYASIASDAVDHVFDTMYYNVVGIDNSVITGGAYRWGHDNGVLTYSPYNYYIFGWVNVDGDWYVTEDVEDVHFYDAGYQVATTFKTGTTVPEGWAIRGVELVASPAPDYQATGTKISGVLQRDSCSDAVGSVWMTAVTTGAGVHTVVDADVNDSTVIGRNSNGYRELGEYATIVIPFPEQPTLRPSSTYRAGYSIEETGYFALAVESINGSYREASPTRPDTYDTIIYFRNNPATKKYANTFPVNGSYQNTVNDPLNAEQSNIWASGHVAEQPMIHLLVGPQQEVTRVNVTINCDSTDYGDVAYGGEAVCGSVIRPVEGSSPIITLSPMAQCKVLSFKVDGTEIIPWDEVEETGDPNCRQLENNALRYTFADIAGDHTVTVVFTEIQGGEPPIAIDPVAANVNMNLQPNPATSQVVLNVEGVEGMLDCAIIDMSGRVVYSSSFNAENEQVINLSNLAKGAYFVRVTNNNFSKVEKLIVR